MFEKRWAVVPPQSFTSNGTPGGVITVMDSSLFKVKQQVNIVANTLPNLNLEIKSIPNDVTIVVGPAGANIFTYSDISIYTVALFSTIGAIEQKRSSVPIEEINRAVYEEEPAVAKRVIAVDKLGRPIDTVVGLDGKVRLATDAAVTVSGLSVDLDALTPPTRPDPDNVLIAGSEDGTKAGTKVAFTNNIVQNIMKAKDRVRSFVYTPVGTKYRLDKIEYTSATFSGVTANKNFVWLDFGTKTERLDDEFWTLT